MTSQEVPSTSTEHAPVRYQPSMEKIGEYEAETIERLIETIDQIQTIVATGSGHARRGVHAKAHGVLVGELQVLPDLPPALAQGLFATARAYPAVLRLSTIPGDVLDDAVSVPRGAALKIVGVDGPRVPGSELDVTQDFLFVNGKAFSAATPEAFLRSLRLLAATTDKAPGLKKALSSVARGLEKVVEGVGGPSPTLLTLGGYPETHILGDEFYSQGAILYGDYIAKLALKPFSERLRALTHKSLDLPGGPNAIREAVVQFFRTQSAVWDIQVQLCTHLDTMPIEDASVTWPETASPYRSVARLHIPAQDAWRADRVELVDERMSFSAWHALAAHRPLGGLMRVRRAVYTAAALYRVQSNHRTLAEPRSAADLL